MAYLPPSTTASLVPGEIRAAAVAVRIALLEKEDIELETLGVLSGVRMREIELAMMSALGIDPGKH